ncbi:uncharacterized protein LOC121927254 isoform X2 [Sceloporus undulatus]|uniref:uncharacterized protein LOC121927254 isoform X2 n=1 Tax=Sceloporus undulatus TaxID=8520 RepID=UPI001C4CF40D|nr:uncharacterized protein LOC121927254 isoform X2 [Sceloporus undulatus]
MNTRQNSVKMPSQANRRNSMEQTSIMEEIKRLSAQMEKNGKDLEKNFRQEIKDLRRDVKADLKSELKSELKGIKQSLEEMEKEVSQITTRIDKLEETSQTLKEKTSELWQHQEQQQDARALDELKQRENSLKIRGLKEQKQENLYDYLLPAIAEYMEIPYQDLLKDVNKLFRVNFIIAKEKSLPRNVVISFVRKKVRDELLFLSYGNPLEVEGSELKFFKDIPKRILQKRGNYKFITINLNKYKVLYKWEKLEGISVKWNQKWFKLNSVSKAKEFWKKFGKKIINTSDNHDYNNKDSLTVDLGGEEEASEEGEDDNDRKDENKDDSLDEKEPSDSDEKQE